MRYLVTGHTGFKGAWLTLLLLERGHEVVGLSLDPLRGSLFERAGLETLVARDLRLDIRNPAETVSALKELEPEVIIHLAAQPLVIESYKNPRFTFETNVNGTLNILEGIAQTPSVKASIVITTDKVYRNTSRIEGYREDEPLGGDDPYSSSKAMADILTQSWVRSFPASPIAIARAGNVIGGGDVSPNRLIPDIISASEANESPVLRYPDAVRPWQHVLDCLNGYLCLTEELLAGKGLGAWNFGPGSESFVTVGKVVEQTQSYLGSTSSWVHAPSDLHEADLLALDSSKAQAELKWANILKYPESIKWTTDWYQEVAIGGSVLDVTRRQIQEFENRRGA
jgi:CDP-glucose 4,6-dehydratase